MTRRNASAITEEIVNYNKVLPEEDKGDLMVLAQSHQRLMEALEEAVLWDGHDETGEPAVWLERAKAAIAEAKGIRQ